MRRSNVVLVGVVAVAAAAMAPAAPQADRVAIHVDTAASLGPMTPMWAWFGYDEPNYTYTPNGRKLLSELAAASPVPVLRADAQPADDRRRRGRAEVGIDERVHRRRERPAASTTGRSSIASSTRISSAR